MTTTETKTGKAMDKSTARPWHTSSAYKLDSLDGNGLWEASIWDQDGVTVGIFRATTKEVAEANAALIVKAVNEYDALCKVSEAAQKFVEIGHALNHEDCELNAALSELSAIRKG